MYEDVKRECGCLWESDRHILYCCVPFYTSHQRILAITMKRCIFLFRGFGCQKVDFNFLIVKLYKAVSVLFHCPKIRKSKSAWMESFPEWRERHQRAIHGSWSLVLPSVAEHHCVSTGRLRFSNFLPKSQKQSRLCTICRPLNFEPLFSKRILHVKQNSLANGFSTSKNLLPQVRQEITSSQYAPYDSINWQVQRVRF